MTTVRGMTDGFPGGQRRSYISTAVFNTVFYTYANNQLVPLPNMYQGYCPAGRILRENGKKLFPDTNPGVTQYYVGVYDAVSFFNGYIDPNDSHFAVYNTDKPVYVPDNYDFGNSMPDLGPSVYTQGNVVAELAPEGDNIGPYGTNVIGMINSTINQYNAYSWLYFNDPGSPAVEAGNNVTGSYAGAYVNDSNLPSLQTYSGEYGTFTGMGLGVLGGNSLSTPIIVAQGQYPNIVAEGDVANIYSVGYSNAYVTTAYASYPNQIYSQLSTDNSNGHIVACGYSNPTLLISSQQSLISANFVNGNTSNSATPQLNMSNANYYTSMYFPSSNIPLIEAGQNSNLIYAGIDGNRGDLYATGMLSLANSVGDMQLSGGTATTTSNTIFTYNPYIFLTYQTKNSGTPGTLTYSINTGAGTLTIDSGQGSDSNYVNWWAVYNNA